MPKQVFYTTAELQQLLARREAGVAGGFTPDEAFRRIEGILADAIADRAELAALKGTPDEVKNPSRGGTNAGLIGGTQGGMTGGPGRGEATTHDMGPALPGGQGSILESDNAKLGSGHQPTRP